jgi:CRISPR-associated protein Csd1
MLHALREYGKRLGGEPGFKRREVRWCIHISKEKGLLNVIPLGDGKSGKMIDRCPDMHAMNSGGKAHFLIETAQTIALYFKTDEDSKKIESGKERHRYYTQLLKESAGEVSILLTVSEFLENDQMREQLRTRMVEQRVKPTDWVMWKIGDSNLQESEEIQLWWRKWRHRDLSNVSNPEQVPSMTMVCLLTGEHVQPLLSQPKITGLAGVGGLATGDTLVGFDKSAFQSFGLEKSSNAAMGAESAQQYIDALNHLIKQQQESTRKNPSRRSNAMMVYWFKETLPLENDPFAMLYGMDTEEQQTASALAQVRKMLDSIRSGKRSQLASNHYYAMTLSGASGRVMVRDWMEGQFLELVANIEAWFSDLSIAHRDGGSCATDPKFLAVGGALVRDLKDLAPSTISVLWRVAIARLPVPLPLMAQALDRIRSDLMKNEKSNHARMGLIKAYFCRDSSGGEQHMKPHLNPDHPDPAYHCGRLLAVLAKLQQSALGDVGAGVVQRFYPSASTAPSMTFGRLVGNSRNHLSKLEGGLSFWYEQRIAEVMGRLGDKIPRILNLEEQGLFALGYYQQLAELRTSKKDDKDKNIQDGEQI